MFRAKVTKAYGLTSRSGTVLALKILDGTVKTGDSVRRHTDGPGRVLKVSAVEFVDSADGGEAAVVVDGVKASDVPAGTEVTNVP